ncbi:Abd-a protein [Roseibium sp. TrichSKD4]|nr:Abd-a protein [Roseibium sp. TrichSKD4]
MKRGLDYHPNRLPWFSSRFYRLKSEAQPVSDTGPLARPFWRRR